MYRPIVKSVLLTIICLLTMGDRQKEDVVLLVPSQADSVSLDPAKILLVSMAKEAGSELIVSTQWQKEKFIPITSKAEKEGFLKELLQTVGGEMTIEHMLISFSYSEGLFRPDTLIYSRSDSMSMRKFWQQPVFAELVKKVKLGNATGVLLDVVGWKDTVVTTSFDDPGNDAYSLFKIHIRLIPGKNTIFFTPVAKPSSAGMYLTRYALDGSGAPPSRQFHNSSLEKYCVECHEGLPSGTDAKAMTADCSSCHKMIGAGSRKHAPVEMAECATCHSWSVEKAAMEARPVPDGCFECHVEKKEAVESSSVIHPVAGECMTCHSPHSTEDDHLLKTRTFNLCVGCHETYKANHPVERHPVRLATITEGDGSVISCVSCHEPHGGKNPALVKVSGGRMAICLQCHRK